MSSHGSNLTSPNLTVTGANGVTYAYRRFGRPGTTPVLFLQHYRGNLDNWDPALVDPIAAEREVILYDAAGVGGSSGHTPATVAAYAADALAFVDALELRTVDLFGFSLGGFVAQEVALVRPRLVRRIVLGGTAPAGGRDIHRFSAEVDSSALRDEPEGADLLHLFFTPSEASTARGTEFLGRIFARTEDRDAPVSLAARDRQLEAIAGWGVPDRSRLARLDGITQPVLVANGDHDIMVPTVNTYLLAGHLPDARVVIYPDANHGFLFQYPAEFAAETNAFLGG